MQTSAAALVPWARTRGELPQIARNRTAIVAWGGRAGSWVDWDLWNPYSIGSDHQNGLNLIYEPLAYQNPYTNGAHFQLTFAMVLWNLQRA